MNEDQDLDMTNPKGARGYGIQDLDHPGEPDYFSHDPATPVPGTAKQTRNEQEGLRSGQHDVPEGSGSP